MNIIVCGGRDYNDRATVFSTLDRFVIERGLMTPPDRFGNTLPAGITIITGGCPTGADANAVDWAIVNWCPFREYKADWSTHGRAAGPIRNQHMLDDSNPNVVIAFPGGKGTADMVRRASTKGVEVITIPSRKVR